MAIRLQDKVNVVAPDANYPYGRIKDNTGSGDGTPVSVNTYGDFHQFFARIMAEAVLTHNSLPDNGTNGFQFYEALKTIISKRIGVFSSTDLNAFYHSGIFQVTTSFTNKPTALVGDALLKVSGEGSNITQYLIDLIDGVQWTRNYNGTVWSSWEVTGGKYVAQLNSGSGGGSTDVLTIPTKTNKNYIIEADLSSKWVSGSDSPGDGGFTKAIAQFKNVAGTLTKISTTTTVHNHQSTASAPSTLQFVAIGTNIICRITTGSGEVYSCKIVAKTVEL